MNEKILGKIKKLLEHARSANEIGSRAEAAAFAEKAQQLLDEYNLSLGDVEQGEDSAFGFEMVNAILQNFELWQTHLLTVISELNGCFGLEHESGYQIVIGNEVDRKLVIELYKYFERLGWELFDNYKKSKQNFGFNHKLVTFGLLNFDASYTTSKEYQNSYLSGYALAVTQRLEAVRRQTTANNPGNTPGLVLINRKSEKARDWAFKNAEISEKNERATDPRAFNLGFEVGQKVALSDKAIED